MINFFLLIVNLFMFSNFCIVSHEVVISKITSETLDQEQQMFQDFFEKFVAGISPSANQSIVRDLFIYEQRSYIDQNSTTFFYNAKIDNQVVGYISGDILPGYRVFIRNIAMNPQMISEQLIKDMLCSVFESLPYVEQISICLPVACTQMIELFQYLGFSLALIQPSNSLDGYVLYEVVMRSKCKICELLYGDTWETEDDSDSNWADKQPMFFQDYAQDGYQESLESYSVVD